MKNYSISEFSKLCHLSIYTLRYYEKEGLLKPSRDSGNRRKYSATDLNWVAFINRLKDTGMPLKEIKHYSDLRREGNSTLEERMELLNHHTHRLDKEIEQLLEHRKKLTQKIIYYREAIEDYRQKKTSNP